MLTSDNPVMLSKGSLLYGAVLCGIALILSQKKAQSHPQCLDFRAPFKVAKQLSFCPQNYSEYGCCTVDRDQGISNVYKRLVTRFSLDSKPKCANLVKTVLASNVINMQPIFLRQKVIKSSIRRLQPQDYALIFARLFTKSVMT